MRKSLFLVSLFLFSFFYFSFGYQYFDLRRYHYDEAISMYGAVRILEGYIPYQDFWTFHMPGRFYILTGVFKIFGVNLKAALLFAIFILSFSSCGIFLFVSKIYGRIPGIFAFVLSLSWLKSYMVYNRSEQFAILFYIICWFVLLKYLSYAGPGWVFIAGILSGIIGLFRIDFGLYCLVALFAVMLLKEWDDCGGQNTKRKAVLILKNNSYLILGFLLVFLPSCIYFIRYGGFKELNSLVLSGTWLKNRHLPLPVFKAGGLIFYFPLLIFAVTAIKLLFFNLKTEKRGEVFYLNFFFLVSGICLYNYTVSRADMSHLLPVMIPVIVLFVSIIFDFIKSINRGRSHYRYFGKAVCFFVCPLLLFSSIVPALRISKHNVQMGKTGELDISRAKGLYDSSEYAQSVISAVKYIQSKTERDEKIFVGNLRHDRLVNNDVMFYFLSERDSATKYYQFEPGFTNTKSIQQAIVRDLIESCVRYVILWTASEGINEPNDSSRSSGIKDLDDFIRKNYELEKEFDYHLVLRNRRHFRP